MLASVIPFFLAARLPVDDTMWTHGPEFVFEVELKYTTTPFSIENADDSKMSNHTAMDLYCRPLHMDSLSCRIDNCEGQIIDLTFDNQQDMPEEVYKRFCDAGRFEIKFNERGVEHLIVPERISVSVLNDLKLIAECLHIGVDLNGVPDGIFNVLQNTTVGQCNVEVKVQHYLPAAEKQMKKTARFDLKSLPQLNKVSGEVLFVQRAINLNNCSHYAPFYFGTYGSHLVEPELPSHLQASYNEMWVSDNRFLATLTRSGTLGPKNKISAITEHLTVRLQNIQAATQQLLDVPEASKTSIEVNSEIHKI
ncbi:uncharacterized protein LOC143259057 [Megalopta genalis]|uniref:uncharacterized protein LOC143259057 n=1 Tax=Megalopta genalis TaxID=115081 RepID=UPI003FD4DFAD